MVKRLLLVLTTLVVSLSALGGTHVWTGAVDDKFSNAGNWFGGSPAGDAAADLSFPSDVRLTAINDLTGLAARSITFSGSGFSITGNAITLVAGADIVDTSGGANTLTCNLALPATSRSRSPATSTTARD